MAGERKQKLRITGVQSADLDGERLVTEHCVEAECYQRNGSWHLFYEEQLEGYPEKFQTHIKCKPNYLEMTRRGKMGTRLVFEPGKTYRTEYATPFGMLLLDVVAESVQIQAAAVNILCPEIRLSYTLENEGQILGRYELQIESIK